MTSQYQKNLDYIIESTKRILEADRPKIDRVDKYLKESKNNENKNIVNSYLSQIKDKTSIQYQFGDIQKFYDRIQNNWTELNKEHFYGKKTGQKQFAEQNIEFFMNFLNNGYSDTLTLDQGLMTNAIISLKKAQKLKGIKILIFKCYEIIYNKKNLSTNQNKFFKINNMPKNQKRKLNFNPNFHIQTIIKRVDTAINNEKQADSLKQAISEYNKVKNTEYMKKWINSPNKCIEEMKSARNKNDMYEFKNLCYIYRGIALTLEFLIQQIKFSDFTLQDYATNNISKTIIQRGIIHGLLSNKLKNLKNITQEADFRRQRNQNRTQKIYYCKSLWFQHKIYKLKSTDIDIDNEQSVTLINVHEQNIISAFYGVFGETFDKVVNQLTVKLYMMFLTQCDEEDQIKFKKWISE